ncbi:hypothetical protein M408DRAFT_233993 [Serendipita vermifera MAFF 305830]|uniref:Major facilitator superfamily (MFS) profile domain-containing protein n=1 Tax=Serendipita vermifera MAFF 305830 TaxID=933852 RepID=A0A0C3AI06_SERVB|nr:hypothetical protein M408DRAFT_233993 [Serendipita vermifera MAFF 305830]
MSKSDTLSTSRVDPATASTIDSNEVTLSEPRKDANDVIDPPKRNVLRSITIVAACTGTMILNVSASTSVSMAIPNIASELHFPSDKVAWIVSAFSLSSGCLLLLFGRLADLYGRKLVWLFGAAWIVATSIACSFTRTDTQLIILRAMHGMGVAAMVPAAVGILAHSFPPGRARSTAFATFSAGAPLGGAIGMVFGGVMAQYASWKGVFYFIAGMAAVIGVAGLFGMDPDPKRTASSSKDHSVDWPGAFLVTAGLVLLTFALSEASETGWGKPLIISFLVIGILLLILFLLWEHYVVTHFSSPPLVSLDIWTRDHGRFGAMQAVAFLEWACFTTLTFWAILYYQNYVRLDPIHTMIRFLPMPVTGVLINVVVALTVGAVNGAYLLALGTAATSTAALLFALINPDAQYWAYGFPAAILCVFGADFVFACGSLFIAKIAHPKEQSVAGALFQTVQMLGTSFGLAITTIAQAGGMKSESEALDLDISNDATALEVPPPVLLKGYRLAQWASFAFGVCGLIVVVLFLHGIGIVGSKKGKGVVAPEEAQPSRQEPIDEKVEESKEKPELSTA